MARCFVAAALVVLSEARGSTLSLLQTKAAKVPASDAEPVDPEMMTQLQERDRLDEELLAAGDGMLLLETGARVGARGTAGGAHKHAHTQHDAHREAHTLDSYLNGRLREVLMLAAEAEESKSASDSTGEFAELGDLKAYGGNVVDLVRRGWTHGGAEAAAKELESPPSLAQVSRISQERMDQASEPGDVLDALGDPVKGLNLNALAAEEPEGLQHRAHEPHEAPTVQPLHFANNSDVAEAVLAAAQAALAPFDDEES